MKNKELLDAVSSISEKYIDEAAPGGRRTYSGVFTRIAAVAACFCIIAGVSLSLSYFVKEPFDHGEVTGTVTENSETTAPVETVTDDTEETKAPIGGVIKCTEHYYSYHTIPGALINLVGSSEYEEWLNLLNDDKTIHEATCQNPLNIKMFIDYFDISREEYEEVCDLLTYCEVDRDVLFNSTDAEIDQYFRNVNELENQGKKRNHYLRVQDYIRMTYKDELSTIEIDHIIDCIPKYVALLGIDRAELEGYIKKAADDIKNDLGVCYTFDYDLDMIYGDNGEVVLKLTDDMTTNELNEMFCKVGRYANSDYDFIEDTENTDNNTDKPAIGGSSYCEVHYPTYHMIGSGIIEYIGKERFEEWYKSIAESGEIPELPEGCNRPINIKMIIDHFDIPMDDFAESCYFPSDSAYNLNLLYNGTLEEIDEYFRDLEQFRYIPDKMGHYDQAYDIIWFNYKDKIAELDLDAEKNSIFMFSIPEVVIMLDIERSELEKIFKDAEQKCIEYYGYCYTFDYDLDIIYGEDGNIAEKNYDDDPTNDISSNELNEMFYRVGRYAE